MEERRNLLPRLMAGLQVGILGGLAILVWFIVLSYWNFRTPWAMFNLFAASLRNYATWGYAFSIVTWIGVSAHLFVCGMLGMLIGYILPTPEPRARISLSGLIFGMIISLIVYEFFWRRYVPQLSQYAAPAAVLIIHLIFGLCLGQFPHFYLKLDPPPPVQAVLLLPAPPPEIQPDPAPEHHPPEPEGT